MYLQAIQASSPNYDFLKYLIGPPSDFDVLTAIIKRVSVTRTDLLRLFRHKSAAELSIITTAWSPAAGLSVTFAALPAAVAPASTASRTATSIGAAGPREKHACLRH